MSLNEPKSSIKNAEELKIPTHNLSENKINNLQNEEIITNTINNPYLQNSQIITTPKQINISKYFIGWNPTVLTIYDYNPAHNLYLSLPCLGLSISANYYYYRKYLLLSAKSLRTFSLILNYFIYYYIGYQTIDLLKHVNERRKD